MDFFKRGRKISVLSDLPPLQNADDAAQRARRVKWDIVQGLQLWELWTGLSLNEMRRRYKRTLLGPAWMTVSLLIFAFVMSIVWAGLWNQKVTEFLPFLLSGLIPWTMISAVIGESTGVFLGGESLIKNQQFPYSVLSYGVVARNVLILAHNLVGFFIVALLCGVTFNSSLLLLIPGMLLVIANCIWISLLVAILCLRFRDFQQIVASLIQITVFVTPIFWKASQIQGDRAIIVHINLFHHMVELLRQPLLGEVPSVLSYGVCAISAVLGWWVAYTLFASKRHRLPYWF
jgi:ABC-type polysaccharide/polyol phosphate export permease